MKQAERAREAIAGDWEELEIARKRDPSAPLRDSAAYLDIVMQATGLGLWDLDSRSGAMSWSESGKALIGVPVEAVMSFARFLDRLHPDDRASCRAVIERALNRANERETFVLECRVDGHGVGDERWLRMRGKAFFPDSHAVRLIGTLLDITEHKTAERRLERLEAIVGEHRGERAPEWPRAEIAERLAREQRVRLAQKMEAIGELTGGIAHDFNNLLTVVQGNLELLRDAHVAPSGRRLLDAADRAAQRGADLTQKLLAFARRQRLVPRPVDIGQLLQAMSEFLRRAISEATTIDLTVDDDLWPAMVDPGQIEHAVVNLALNGRDAMREGGRLTLAAGNARRSDAGMPDDLAAGDYVVIAVGDTGVGMDERVLERACDPFFTTKDVGRGTGLGLSQVHGIAKQSGGTLRLKSRLGEGTIAELFLPRAGIEG